jgi:uroporphyrinogen-III synthase
LSVRVLVTRPQPRATATALALRARGHEPVVAPLSEIELVCEVDPKTGPWAAIVLTSANGLGGIVSFARNIQCRGVPIFAVGDVTAKAARDIGFTQVTSAGGNVSDLINLVTAQLKPPARLLYVAGQERSGDLAGALRAKNFEVDLVVVYRSVTARVLPEAAAAALAGGIDAVLHFSRAAAETFINAVGNSNLVAAALNTPLHLCLSERVAAPLRKAGAVRIQIAARPNENALLDLCGRQTI